MPIVRLTSASHLYGGTRRAARVDLRIGSSSLKERSFELEDSALAIIERSALQAQRSRRPCIG